MQLDCSFYHYLATKGRWWDSTWGGLLHVLISFIGRYEPLYCCLGTTKECAALYGKLPQRVYDEILRGVAILDAEFGPERDYFECGGYALIADTKENLHCARKVFDDRFHSCEWATKMGNSGYVSALYLLNNEVSVVLYIKESLANNDILENLED